MYGLIDEVQELRADVKEARERWRACEEGWNKVIKQAEGFLRERDRLQGELTYAAIRVREARAENVRLRALAKRRRKPRRLLADARELIDRLVENAEELSPFARRTRRALDRILSKEGDAEGTQP